MKIVVAHPFQQHSFKTAAAIKETGELYKYITTVYYKKKTITYILCKLLFKDTLSRAKARRTNLLDDDDVEIFNEWTNLLLLLLQRIDKLKYLYNWWYKYSLNIFNKNLLKFIKKNGVDVVIVYDTLASKFIEELKKENINCKVILDMSAPNANYINYIFSKEKEMVTKKFFKKSLENDNEYFQYKCKAASIELKYADIFLVASNFSAESLKWGGVSTKKIYKCIYGTYENNYINNFQIKNKMKSRNKIKCCFIGKVSIEKGAHHLFNIIDRLKRKDLEFHFYGFYNKNEEYYKKYKSFCFFHGHIPHIKMLEEIKSMDIIIFPSLADGFGFSVTEGLVSNCIAICSKNAGVSELIVDSYNGYTYPYWDEEKLLYILENLTIKQIRKMQKNALNSIVKYTWEAYNLNLKRVIEDIKRGEI